MSSLPQEGFLLREQIAKIQIDHARMSVLGRAGRHEPGTPGEVGVLRKNLQPSVVSCFQSVRIYPSVGSWTARLALEEEPA